MNSDPLTGVQVFERGWVSSNNVLIHAAPGEAGAWLIDTSCDHHAPQTLALLRHALAGRPLAGIANTHLHFDHCGGNRAVQEAFAAPLLIPPGQAEAVAAWDEAALVFQSGERQRVPPFRHHGVLRPGGALVAGGREWEVIAAAGHDPHMVMLFDRRRGVLISADALWENGFGIVFPELEGEPGFDDMDQTLEQIAALAPRLVIPGHGAPFADVGDALARARRRLGGFRADPRRHLSYVVKVQLKSYLLEARQRELAEVLAWAVTTPMFVKAWARLERPGTPEAWTAELLDELVTAGALRRDGTMLYDA